jgi:hypothetical protein
MNKFGFFLKTPNLFEFLILSMFIFIELILLNIKYYQVDSIGGIKNIEVCLFIALWFIPIATPLVERLRNLSVLIIWCVICVIWIIYTNNFVMAWLPLFVLIYSQISRLIFRAIFGYNPIQLLATTNHLFQRYSKIEKRESTKLDFQYSIIYSVTGILLSILFAYPNFR